MTRKPYQKPTLRTLGPTFTRPASEPAPAAPPADRAAWDALRMLDRKALRELGLRAFNDPNDLGGRNHGLDGRDRFEGKVLMLLPGEWYREIPSNYLLTTIRGAKIFFRPGVTDIRFGMLPYGLLVKA